MKQLGTATIYVVDDDDAVRDSMRVLLESHGMSVHDYPSADHFLNDPKSAGKDNHPCCLLLDLHMPGMGGAELLEKLKQTGRSIPAIVLTARAEPPLRERVHRAGALFLLDKPVSEDDLTKAIGDALASEAAR